MKRNSSSVLGHVLMLLLLSILFYKTHSALPSSHHQQLSITGFRRSLRRVSGLFCYFNIRSLGRLAWRFQLLLPSLSPFLLVSNAPLKILLAFLREAMTSVPGTDSLTWNDEQTRFYLRLRINEKLKGNARKLMINEAGRETIINKFYEEFGVKLPWRKFGIKYNTCKKQYDTFKKLTHNRTGLGYDSKGCIEMSEDWWNEQCKDFPGGRKIKDKPVPNVDLMEELFGTVYISGAEGWTAQQGEEHLDTMNDVGSEIRGQEADDGFASRQNIIPPTQEGDVGSESRHNGPSSSSRTRANRKRSRIQAGQAVADVIRDSIESRDRILSQKNQLIESHPEFTCSQLRAMQVLHSLSSIRMWSPLYKAAILHLKEDATNRQTFLSYEDEENKVLYLEFATRESRET